MGLLDHLETQLERQIPAQLQAALQQALDDYQPLCDRCRLAMHRHHRYARAIATGYGEVRLQIPVFRCGQCRPKTKRCPRSNLKPLRWKDGALLSSAIRLVAGFRRRGSAVWRHRLQPAAGNRAVPLSGAPAGSSRCCRRTG